MIAFKFDHGHFVTYDAKLDRICPTAISYRSQGVSKYKLRHYRKESSVYSLLFLDLDMGCHVFVLTMVSRDDGLVTIAAITLYNVARIIAIAVTFAVTPFVAASAPTLITTLNAITVATVNARVASFSVNKIATVVASGTGIRQFTQSRRI